MEKRHVVFLAFVLSVSVSAEECGVAELVKTQEVCDAKWGYNMKAMITGRGDIQDFAKTVEFCGSQDRTTIDQCYKDTFAPCISGWPEELRVAMERQFNSFFEALDYLCSEISVVEENIDCLNGIMGEITACFSTAARQNMDALTEIFDDENVSEDLENLERMGRQTEECVRDVTTNRCNSEIGGILGNFIYGASMHTNV